MKRKKNALNERASEGVGRKSEKKMNEIIPGFLEYTQYELNFSPQTIVKYEDSRWGENC